MHIGYARVSTAFPNLAPQRERLRDAGCERIFVDEDVNGSARPQLDQVLALIKPGDVLIVCKFDRLGRTLSHLIELTNDLAQRGVGFRSLSDGIDTTNEHGHVLRDMLSALAKFERSLVTERTRAGLLAARRRGAKLGRKPKLTADQIEYAKRLIDAGESPTHVAKTVGVSTATLYRAIPAGASNRNTPDLFAGL